MRSIGRRPLRALVFAGFGLLVAGCPNEPPREPPLVADPPLDGPGPGAGDAQTALSRGVAFIKAEKYDEAKGLLEKSMASKPSAEAAFYLALVKEKTNDRAGAEAGYKEALRLDPKASEAAENLAALYLDEPPRPDLAIPILNNALAASPGNARLHQNLGFAYGLKRDVANAAKHYEAAIAKQDDFQIRFAYGTVLFENKEPARAAEQLKKALAAAKDDPPVLVTLGRMLGATKSYTECVQAFDRAIKLKATEAEWFVRRGTCRHELKNEAGAEADFEAALKVDPNFAPAHYYLGLSLITQKKNVAGARALEKAVKTGAGTPIGKLAKDRLDELFNRKPK
jgi:tetratricopeptide (TPR) repeat protein